jgi:hypothetical protein
MSHIPPIASTPAHLEGHVTGAVTSIANTAQTAASPITPQAPSAIAVSFAFDSIEKTLNVVIKDERSGEVVRTIEFTQMPTDIYRSDKLNGLLLDQFV